MAITRNPPPKNRLSKSSAPKSAKPKKSDSSLKKARGASASKESAAPSRKGSKKSSKPPVLHADMVENVRDVRAGKKQVKRMEKRVAELDETSVRLQKRPLLQRLVQPTGRQIVENPETGAHMPLKRAKESAKAELAEARNDVAALRKSPRVQNIAKGMQEKVNAAATQTLKNKVEHLKSELGKIDAEVQGLSKGKAVSGRLLADRIGELGALLKTLAAHTGALSKQVSQLEAVSAGHGTEEVSADELLRELVPELRERRQSAARFYADDEEA